MENYSKEISNIINNVVSDIDRSIYWHIRKYTHRLYQHKDIQYFIYSQYMNDEHLKKNIHLNDLYKLYEYLFKAAFYYNPCLECVNILAPFVSEQYRMEFANFNPIIFGPISNEIIHLQHYSHIEIVNIWPTDIDIEIWVEFVHE